MSRSLKKGPFADAHLLNKIEAQADSEKETSHQDLVPSLDNFP